MTDRGLPNPLLRRGAASPDAPDTPYQAIDLPRARPRAIIPMSSNTLVLVACLAVAAVLLLGLGNMLRGGSANLSQRLMRLRVVLQLVAIVVIMGVLWWRGA